MYVIYTTVSHVKLRQNLPSMPRPVTNQEQNQDQDCSGLVNQDQSQDQDHVTQQQQRELTVQRQTGHKLTV